MMLLKYNLIILINERYDLWICFVCFTKCLCVYINIQRHIQRNALILLSFSQTNQPKKCSRHCPNTKNGGLFIYGTWFATSALIIPSTSWQLLYQSCSISSHEINYGRQLLRNLYRSTKYNWSQYVRHEIMCHFDMSMWFQSNHLVCGLSKILESLSMKYLNTEWLFEIGTTPLF